MRDTRFQTLRLKPIRDHKPHCVLDVGCGKPANQFMRLLFYGLQLLDGFDTTAANRPGSIPNMLYDGGFRPITQTSQVNMLFGTLVLHDAIRPSQWIKQKTI